jgi:hypothetical protein
MLEESDQIDIITTSSDGKLQLVIADAGLITDPQQRFETFIRKLKAYVGYAISPDFKKDHPQHDIKDVQILVMCKIPPTDEMMKIKQVTPHGQHDQAIDVLFQVFPGSDGPETSSKKSEPQRVTNNSEKKDWADLKRRLAWPDGASASQATVTSVPYSNHESITNELVSKNRNFVVHLAFIIALVFIVVLNYYLYFVSPITRTGWTLKLMGSGLAELMMWAFTYGMCLKAKNKILFGILSAVTLFTGVVIIRLWGWICIIAMYLLFRKMPKEN